MSRATLLLATLLTLAGGGAARAASEEPEFEPTEVDIVPAFETAAHEDDVAVIIGVEKYRSAPPSQYSAGDAKLMRDYLVAMGYPARNIELLTDDRATSGDMKRVLERWLPNKVKPESRVVVYYSGHGAPEPSTGKAYLVPWDGDPTYLEDTAYAVTRLQEVLAKLPAKEVVVILDACFSGLGKKGEGRTLLAEGARPMIVSGPEALPPSAKLAVLSAARRSQISASNPEYRHGLLTYHLLKAVREGKKTLSEIYATLKSRVEDDAKARNVDQSPQLSLEEGPDAASKFLLADFTSVRAEGPKPKVSEKDAAAFEAQKKKMEEQQKKLDEERAGMKAKQEALEKEMAEKNRRLEAEAAEKARRVEAEAAERRAREERRRREAEAELERRRREIENTRPSGQEDPVFVPPSF
ncbi:MAG: caspase family protein [Elusimicrobia bacterium]|nr:caspase family protein [Elusimicrobiota bacterium]